MTNIKWNPFNKNSLMKSNNMKISSGKINNF